MTVARPAIFLDRDGTLIVERNFLARPDGVELLPGAARALVALRAAGYALVLATNQSGVARGYFDEGVLARIHTRLSELLAAEGASLDLILYAPSHPELPLLPGWDATWRKPRPGMFLEAARRLDLDLARSWSIGDSLRDLEGARNADVPGRILVRTGNGEGVLADLEPAHRDWFDVDDDLLAASQRILAGGPPPQGK